MPRVEGIFAKLGKARFFTMLDLKSGYHHIALNDDVITKTAFVMPLGKYEYLKVPFGLAQAPTYFQNLMNKVLNGLHFTLAYLDDVIIFSKTAEQHLKHIQILLTRLKQAKLRLKKEQVLVLQARASLSGTLADDQWNQTTIREGKAISKMKPPKNQKGVEEFWGWLATTGNS